MANEFIHIDPGAILTKAEFELITGHQFNSQATGDILYASTSTQLSRLGIGSNTNVLEITGGVPAWVATSGTGSVARVSSPTFVTPALGTPSALVGTNISGTASSLTAGTVTTNANLTGHVTSSGNAAVLGSFTSAQLAGALTNETGSGLAVFGTSPTLVTPALGTPASGVMTNVSGTASSLTAGNVSTNANLTGVVTSTGNATAIADKALAIAKLADGTDGELITWNASGVIAAVAAGTDTHVLTSNGAGAAPTFQSAAGGGPSQATQAAIEAETNEDTYAPPDLLKHSPGVAKAWCRWEQVSSHSITASYNITSVSDGGQTGDTDILWATDFSDTNYAVAAMAHYNSIAQTGDSAFATTGITVIVNDVTSHALKDETDVCIVAFGDQ
jgi:hypothetical protein